MQNIKHNGCTLAYAVSGTGPPLFLMPSFDGETRWYEYLLPELEKNYTCITMSHRGVAPSTVPNRPWTVETLASDAQVVIEAAGFKSVNVIGYSAGGVVAQILASRCRDAVRSVIIINTSPDSPTAIPSVASFFSRGSTVVEKLARGGMVEQADKVTSPQEPSLVQMARAILTIPGVHTVRGISAPTLVIHGTADTDVSPVNAWFLQRSLSVGTMQFMRGSTHDSLLKGQESYELLQHMRTFLDIHELNEPPLRKGTPLDGLSRKSRWERHIRRKLTQQRKPSEVSDVERTHSEKTL